MFDILIINGPNLNLLGTREPEIYGTETWNDIEVRLKKNVLALNINIETYQSNHLGDLVDFIQKTAVTKHGVIINPAAFTNTGFSLLDALTSVNKPFIEVHLSNIFNREKWHRESIFSQSAIGQIIGFKGFVYDLALTGIVNFLNNQHIST